MVSNVLKVIRNTPFSERKTLPLVLLWNIPRRKSIYATLWIRCDSQRFLTLFQTFSKRVRKTCYSSQFDLKIFSVGMCPIITYGVVFCFMLSLRYTWLGFTTEFIKRNTTEIVLGCQGKVFFKSMNQLTLFLIYFYETLRYI